MNHEPNHDESKNWPEPRVEKLLGWFFGEEMPAALRDEPANVPQLSSPMLASPMLAAAMSDRASTTSTAKWLLPLCVAVLVGSVWVLQHVTPREPVTLVAHRSSPNIELETTSLPWMVEQISYTGADGVLEQRSELRWTSRSYYEPAAGVWVEWSAPELVIDVETAAGGDRPEQRL